MSENLTFLIIGIIYVDETENSGIAKISDKVDNKIDKIVNTQTTKTF